MFNISQSLVLRRAPLMLRAQTRSLSIFDYFKKKTEADVEQAKFSKESKSMIE